jgi:hypothetical protein
MADEPEKTSEEETRQAKREEKKRKEKERMKKHGRSLAQMYRDAIEKRKKEK